MLKKTKESINKNSGITLIALVVTLVILLILAGVSIDFVLGEDGIVGKAVLAREKQQIADYKEAIDLILIDAHMQTYFDTMTQAQFEQYVMQKMMQNSLFEGSQIGDTQELFGAAVRNVFLLTKEGYYFHITKNEAIYAGKTQQEVGLYLFSLDDTDDDIDEVYTYTYAGYGQHDVYDGSGDPVTEEYCTPIYDSEVGVWKCEYCDTIFNFSSCDDHAHHYITSNSELEEADWAVECSFEDGYCIYCGQSEEEEEEEELCPMYPDGEGGHSYAQCGYCEYCHDAYDEEYDEYAGDHSFMSDGTCQYCGYYDEEYDDNLSNEEPEEPEEPTEDECPMGGPHMPDGMGRCANCGAEI